MRFVVSWNLKQFKRKIRKKKKKEEEDDFQLILEINVDANAYGKQIKKDSVKIVLSPLDNCTPCFHTVNLNLTPIPRKYNTIYSL